MYLVPVAKLFQQLSGTYVWILFLEQQIKPLVHFSWRWTASQQKKTTTWKLNDKVRVLVTLWQMWMEGKWLEPECATHLPWPPAAARQSWMCSDRNHSAGRALWSGDQGDSAGGSSCLVCRRPPEARTEFSPCPVASASPPSAAASCTSEASDSGSGWLAICGTQVRKNRHISLILIQMASSVRKTLASRSRPGVSHHWKLSEKCYVK